MRSVAANLGIGTTETVRKWVRRAEIDAGARPGVTTEESVEMRRLRAEVRELRRAKRDPPGSSGFLRGGARPATQDLVRFVCVHAERRTVDGVRWGVEPICRVLTEHGTPDRPQHLLRRQEPTRHPSCQARRGTEGQDHDGPPRQLRRLRCPQGVAGAESGGHRGRPLHRGAADGRAGHARRTTRQDPTHHDRRPEGGPPGRSGAP